MKQPSLYPLTFKPVLKDYIWGGRNLEKWGRILPTRGVIAESWEIASHKDGTTVVDNGDLAGKPLSQIQAEYGVDLIGRNHTWALEKGRFPLLIKLLDANRPLSVQVHPTDEYALAHEDNELGKTEMWYVLHAEPNASIIMGVKAATTPQNFRRAIESGQLEKYLHYLPVETGNHIHVPAGSLHAIMGGALIAEIQQNSNTTYRVYDWKRVNTEGQSRPLHIRKALDVVNFSQVEPGLLPPKHITDKQGIHCFELCRNAYFVTERLEMAAGTTYQGNCTGTTMEIWGLIAGNAVISDREYQAIQFVLLPASLGKFTIRATSTATLLRIYTG